VHTVLWSHWKVMTVDSAYRAVVTLESNDSRQCVPCCGHTQK